MRHALASLFALMAVLFAGAPARAGDKPPAAFMEVTFETPEGGAFAQEMVVMHVRSYFKSRATLESLEQPVLDDLGWMQLGQDDWAPTKVGAETYFGFERRLAVFAPEARRYTIPPFTHHVTLIDPEGVRWKVDATSPPAVLDIRPWLQATGGPLDENTWWLPARAVSVADNWAGDPSAIGPGETIRRTIELIAVGVPAEQLPPTIDTTTPGLIIFPGPVGRRTEVVGGVPVGHAVYSYDIRPHTGSAVILPELLVPWFDTAAREMRQAIVPGASVGRGMAPVGRPALEALDPAERPLVERLAPFGAALAAFALGACALLLPGRRDREPLPPRIAARWREARRTGTVRLAALKGDPKALRAAIYALARSDAAEGAEWIGKAQGPMTRIDGALFAPAASLGSGQGLRADAQAVLAARRQILRSTQTRSPAAGVASLRH